MKINFTLPEDQLVHEFCTNPECNAEAVESVVRGDRSFFRCNVCQNESERRIVIDPDRIHWVDPVTKELWHESVGVFIFNSNGDLLLFERTTWPYLYTIPAGHLRNGETALRGAILEVIEETGIVAEKLDLLLEADLTGDICVYGSDNHHYHLFKTRVNNDVEVNIKYEGKNPIWVNYQEAMELDTIYPIKFILQKFGDSLFKGITEK
ncbi:MAG: hypothetical protein OHK0017_08630 [Patescibacteria group bacterium]